MIKRTADLKPVAKTAVKQTPKSLGGRPTTERAAEIAGTVMAATIQAFAGSGSDFSMDEVAKMAGVSKQAIYRRWTSKFDLLADAVTFGLEQMNREGDEIVASNPLDALRQVSWQRMSGDPQLGTRLSFFLIAESFRNEAIKKHLNDLRPKILGVFIRRLEELERVGLRAEGDIVSQAEILNDLLNAATHSLVIRGTTGAADMAREFEIRWQAFCKIAIK